MIRDPPTDILLISGNTYGPVLLLTRIIHPIIYTGISFESDQRRGTRAGYKAILPTNNTGRISGRPEPYSPTNLQPDRRGFTPYGPCSVILQHILQGERYSA